MALVNCHDCGNPISRNALICPQCGVKPREKTSILTWVVGAIFLVIVFRTCSSLNERAAPVAGATLVPSLPAKPPCDAASFTVKNIKSRREYDHAIFTATVTNTGSTACGVQLKASTYDKAGAVVGTNDFWPASIRNIEPGASENFNSFLRFDPAIKTFEITPISARVWAAR